MEKKEKCEFCGCLIKNYIGTDRTKFNACCGKFFITFSKGKRPRIIKANVEDASDILTPSWCPKIFGVTSRTINAQDLIDDDEETYENPPSHTEIKQEAKTTTAMTYTEKREKLMSLPRRLAWDEIKEGKYYVIPQILYQAPKIVKVILKTDTLIRCNEVKYDGTVSTVATSIYPQDIDAVFLVEHHKF